MKRTVAIIASLTFCIVLVLLAGDVARAQSKELLRENCRAAQVYVATSLRDTDLRARVDRAQAYQYVYERLDMLASRLEHNKQAGAQDTREVVEHLSQEIRQYAQKTEGCSDKSHSVKGGALRYYSNAA